jgi:hypothetical protein
VNEQVASASASTSISALVMLEQISMDFTHSLRA